MLNLIALIKETNLSRDLSNTKRRLWKIGEEQGEVWQAVLDVTSSHHSRDKTWEDVREELVDCFVVATDVALAFNPDLKFDFHIRHISNFEETYFADKLFLTNHLVYSLNHVLDEYSKDHTNFDAENGACISKSLAILFFELAVLVFPDEVEATEEHLFDHFYLEVSRKVEKWKSKYKPN